MLTLENISYQFNGKIIFQNINFSIVPGSIFLLKGPNGSGKTTLLKILAGLITPSTGHVKWNDFNIKDDLVAYHRYCVSYLGTKNAIKHDLSILDNLLFWASMKSSRELILPAMSHFKIAEIAEVKCVKLSSGLLKRVALARLIVSNTDLWLMDEPDTFLDEEAKNSLQKLITVKAREGGIVIIASHNLFDFPKTSTISMEEFKPERKSC